MKNLGFFVSLLFLTVLGFSSAAFAGGEGIEVVQTPVIYYQYPAAATVGEQIYFQTNLFSDIDFVIARFQRVDGIKGDGTLKLVGREQVTVEDAWGGGVYFKIPSQLDGGDYKYLTGQGQYVIKFQSIEGETTNSALFTVSPPELVLKTPAAGMDIATGDYIRASWKARGVDQVFLTLISSDWNIRFRLNDGYTVWGGITEHTFQVPELPEGFYSVIVESSGWEYASSYGELFYIHKPKKPVVPPSVSGLYSPTEIFVGEKALWTFGVENASWANLYWGDDSKEGLDINSKTASHTFTSPGEYLATVVVYSDLSGERAEFSFNAYVKERPKPFDPKAEGYVEEVEAQAMAVNFFSENADSYAQKYFEENFEVNAKHYADEYFAAHAEEYLDQQLAGCVVVKINAIKNGKVSAEVVASPENFPLTVATGVITRSGPAMRLGFKKKK